MGSECARLLSPMSWAPAELPALLTTAGTAHGRAAVLHQQVKRGAGVGDPAPHPLPMCFTPTPHRCPSVSLGSWTAECDLL